MVQDYIDYFRMIAVRNKKIRHVVAAESDDHPEMGERRFTLFNMEQIAKAVKTAMWEGPALHLHVYDWRFAGADNYDLQKRLTAGFLVTRKVDNNDVASQAAAFVECEQIVEEILAQLAKDYKSMSAGCTFPFGQIFLADTTVSSAGPIFDNRYGWWVEIPFLKKANNINDELATAAFDV